MGKRVVAIVGALALVAAALFVRHALSDRGNGDGGPGAGTDSGSGGLPVVACTPDLADICQALADDGKVTPAAETLDLDGAVDPPQEVDAWITWDPAPGIANLQDVNSEVWTGSTAIAQAELAILVSPAAREGLAAACKSSLRWSCIAENAGDDLPTGTGSPETAEGLARIAPLASSLHAPGDPTEVKGDLLTQVVEGPVDGQADAASMIERITTRSGALALVIGPKLVLDVAAASQQGQGQQLAVQQPSPPERIVAVLAVRSGRAAPDVLDAIRSPTVVEAWKGRGVSQGSAQLATEDRIGELYQIRERG